MWLTHIVRERNAARENLLAMAVPIG